MQKILGRHLNTEYDPACYFEMYWAQNVPELLRPCLPCIKREGLGEPPNAVTNEVSIVGTM